jgi:hypothetical protein
MGSAGADLREADLSGAALIEADLSGANFTEAHLGGAYLSQANLRGAKLGGADLSKAHLNGADLSRAYLTQANLHGANLQASMLVDTDFTAADLTGCQIYGVSAWGLKLERAKQQNLVITPEDEPQITVDNIEVAQFIYLLRHNEKLRDFINTITSKAVLILGRFTKERKPVLAALREELRQQQHYPVGHLGFIPMQQRDEFASIQLIKLHPLPLPP